MKKAIAVANWKANKNISETREWIEVFKRESKGLDKVQIIICPVFSTLFVAKNDLSDTNISLGSQTVSSYGQGAFTGEVPAELLKDLVSYSIVGHSERRRYFNENSKQIVKKIENLFAVGIKPILCISNLAQLDEYLSLDNLFKEKAREIIFVYEPPSAISGGGDYHPEEILSVKQNVGKMREKLGDETSVLYGGSVNKEILKDYLNVTKINGVLVGKASLDPLEFSEISNILASFVI